MEKHSLACDIQSGDQSLKATISYNLAYEYNS